MTQMAKGNDSFSLTKDDLEGGNRKVAPGGTYVVALDKKNTEIKKGQNGNLLNICVKISQGKHKNVRIFDNIAAHVGWKIAQVIAAFGLTLKKGTLQDLLKKILDSDGEIRVVVREDKYQGRPKNEIVQYLPAGDDEDADDDEDEDEDDDKDEDEDEDGDDDDSDDDSDDDDDDDDDDEDGDDDSDDDDDDDSDDDDDEDEDEDEEEVKPAKAKKPTAKKAAAKKTARKRK